MIDFALGNYLDKGYGVFYNSETLKTPNDNLRIRAIECLTRAPENDIEVKK